jgi:ABC-2 type transport system permease protein
MKRVWNVYRAQFRTWAAVQLQYRVALVIWLIGMVLEPVVYLVVWTTVARSGGGQVGSYRTSDFAAYFIVLMLVNHATFTWIIYGIEMRVRQGTLSPLLLRPIHPIHADLAENLTYKTLTLSVMLPAAVVLALVFHPSLHPAPWAVAAFPAVLVLAIALRFVVEWTVSLVGFWTTRMGAIDQMYYVSVLFLSGQVAPLALFPPQIRTLATLLPFRWMVAFPVELLLGRLEPREVLTGCLMQVGWLALGLVLLAGAWRIGVRRYSAVGS